MISRRQYFSIVLIMVAVFLLFQGTLLGREHWGREQQSSGYAEETGLRSDAVWSAPEGAEAEAAAARRGLAAGKIVCLAPKDAPEAKAAALWARYARRTLRFAAAPEDPLCAEAELLLVPARTLETRPEELRALTERGVSLLCLSLPAAETVAESDALRALLGIRFLYRPSVTLEGLHLFSGFLLGGERIYVPENDKEAAERQDLPLTLPWYVVRGGTETYLRGELGEADLAEMAEKGLKDEDRPAVWWRSHSGNAEVFAVNGPYMADPAVAGGVLQAVLSQMEETSVYPVLDAQLFSVVDFPALSNENSAELLRLYGREMTDVTSQIILPSLVPLPNRYGIPFTAFAAPQTDYGDDAGPQPGLAGQMGKTLREMRSELGLSLHERDGAPLSVRLAEDSAAMDREETPPVFSAVWAEDDELAALAVSAAPCLTEVRTVMTAPDASAAPLDYFIENVTLLRATGDAAAHSYFQDLRMLCRETALGYDNSYCDLADIWHPESDDDQWQKRVELVVSNLTTYGRPFEAFAHVTASGADAKLRRFLRIDYSVHREGDRITLETVPETPGCSFVLRLNGETVAETDGGSCTAIEDGAFLLRAEDGRMELRVERTGLLAALDGA